MAQEKLLELLRRVQEGTVSPEQAVLELKVSPFEDLGYAKVDHHRAIRQGIPEVIFGSGKTAEQILGIASAMRRRGNENILITRLSDEKARILAEQLPLTYDPVSRIGIIGQKGEVTASGTIVVATGGTR